MQQPLKRRNRPGFPPSFPGFPGWAHVRNMMPFLSEAERAFEEIVRRDGGSVGPDYPSLDIEDDEHEVRVLAELPGVKKDEFELELSSSGQTLTLRGEKRRRWANNRQDVRGARSSERAFGAFCREIPLPASVDPGRVEATLEDGILTICLPKTANGAGARRISVRELRPADESKPMEAETRDPGAP